MNGRGVGEGGPASPVPPSAGPAERGLIRVFDALVDALERARARRRLMALSDRGLADLGLGRSEAFRESAKPCWRP
ncbi:MAG: DUF1127 domain-containing protein [Proteobacteria bacterium]|nr:DUF1127 domain-containing protein [Pseudomonadota bacterium]